MASKARLRVRLSRWLARVGFTQDWFLIPMAALIGTLGGLIATGFDRLVHWTGQAFYWYWDHGSQSRFAYVLLVVLPAVGGLLVGLSRRFVFRLPQSHGIPMVIEAVARRQGEMPLKNGLAKAVHAALTIGSGGSAGVEGPIIQVGSVAGSAAGKFMTVRREHMQTLVGCGAAASMAGIFNAPIAGVVFVLEVLLRDFSIRTFMPIVVASVFGTAVARAVMGKHEAVFAMPETMHLYQFKLVELLPYAGLGLLCGILGVVVIYVIGYAGRAWAKIKAPSFIKPAIGGALLGVFGIVFLIVFKERVTGVDLPLFFGNGYPVIEWMLDTDTYTPGHGSGGTVMGATIPLLAFMLAFKLLGTWLTLGSGGAGGIFAPSLFVGACVGGAFGMVLDWLGMLPMLPGSNPATYALAGMAGALAATAHCPLTAFLLVFEITQEYRVILPVMLVTILATTCSQFFHRDSIYGLWLRQHGVRMGTAADLTLLRRLRAADVNLVPAVLVQPSEPAARLVELAEDYAAVDFVVCDEHDCYTGMVVGEDLRTTLVQREAIPLMIVGELMRTNLPTVEPDETLDMVLDKFSRHDVESLAVLDGRQHVRGLITRPRLMRAYQRVLSR